MVAIGYGAHLSSLRSVPFSFSSLSTQQVLPTQETKTNETALNATLILTLNLSLVFTLSKVLSALSLSIKRSANTLFYPPLKVLGRPRIISNSFPHVGNCGHGCALCRKYYFNVMCGAHMFGQWPGDLECGVRGSN